MKKCPQCGYERKESDSIIREKECPRCGIIYSKWQPPNPEGADRPPVAPATPSAPAHAAEETGGKKRMPVERIVLFAALAVIFITVAYFLASSSKVNKFQSEKSREEAASSDEALNQGAKTPENLSTRGYDDGVNGHKAATREMSITDIIRENKDSIVLVKTSSTIGSGFFINRDGAIVTNRHVLSKAGHAEIKTVGGKVFQIREILQEDQEADLVIASTDAPPQESKPVSLSGSLPDIGEKIVVIGNPMGLEQTVSDGIVSAIRRNQYAVDLIQVTAPVSAGNSGGPLFNMYGEVIGVATFQYRSGQNLNFCVSASRVAALKQGRQANGAFSSDGDAHSPAGRDVYCYADSNGQVSFVDWKTDMLVSRPDGSLDRGKYHSWVLEQIGGNPDQINPDAEAREDVERNREQLFKSVFPGRSIDDTTLTDAEKEWLERRYKRHYVDVYNKATLRRNDAIRKYGEMMNAFDTFNAARKTQ